MNETERDPLDVAAGLAEEIFGEWKKYARDWTTLLDALAKEAANAQSRLEMARRLQAALGGQLPLIPGAVTVPEPRKPRAKSRRLMHSQRVGDVVKFVCPKCEYEVLDPGDLTTSQFKRGIPCPKCNEPAADAATAKRLSRQSTLSTGEEDSLVPDKE